MTLPIYKNLGQLRYRLALRLGFGGQGGATATIKPLLDDFIEEAQERLYQLFGDMLLRDYVVDQEIKTGQVLYDVDPNADIQRIDDVNVKYAGEWLPLEKGLNVRHMTDDTGIPCRYAIVYGTTGTAQIQIAPEPDQDYTLGYMFTRKLSPLTQDEHKTTINSHAVFLLALAEALNHYGRDHADKVAGAAAQMLGQLRARKNRNKKITRGTPGHRVMPELVEFQEKINQINYDRDVLVSEVGDWLIAE